MKIPQDLAIQQYSVRSDEIVEKSARWPGREMGFEAAQAVMPELQGIESVLEEVNPQKQQTQKPKSRWHWLSGAFVWHWVVVC